MLRPTNRATPQTVAWGHYDATDKPVLTIRSGDTVVIHTLLTNSPASLEKAGVAPAQIEPALRAVYGGVPASARVSDINARPRLGSSKRCE